MSMVHVETVKVTFSEEQMLKIMEKFIIDKYYQIKYQSFALESAIFNFDDNGNAVCEIIYQKSVRSDEFEEI